LYLKNITLRGFKSFANRSQLVFEPGISVIVGPNGSGKSNIVDAISWVLGEQSAKSLRGSSMEDVIFRSKKEDLAIAEVSLIFNNSDKFFPLEFNDVKFTRRVYQKGGSDYFINSTPSRLVDIQDLTSEKGMGKGLYTIVNQGQIDDIALLKPAEQKMIIDEILGIEKHKIRREKSKNKLAKVASDIERIDDLVQEVKRTLDPLEVESARAQKYFEVLNNLKQEEISLFISELGDLNKLWESENARYGKADKTRNQITLQLKYVEDEKAEFELNFKAQQHRYDKLKISIDNYNLLNNKLDSFLTLSESKKNIFNTLNNMFKVEYSSIKDSIQRLLTENKNSLNDSRRDNNVEIYKIFVGKLNDLKEKINVFLNKFREYLNHQNLISEIDNDASLINRDIEELRLTFEENYKKNSSSIYLVNQKKIGSGDIKKIKKEIENRLETIKNLQEYCHKKIKDSENLYDLLNNLKKTSDYIVAKSYPEFEELLSVINTYNLKLNEFLIKMNNLSFQKQNIENEIYRIELKREQIKEKVKKLTEDVLDNYDLSMEYILKNYKPAQDIEKTKKIVKKLKEEIRSFGSVNPNATIEYKRLKERYDFLNIQKDDLIESKIQLEELIREINERIEDIFISKFEEINLNFANYFKALFPFGNGQMSLINIQSEVGNDYGIELKVDIGNDKMIPLSLLSGGEKALVSIAFLFSIFATNHSPFYVFDEIDASLDDVNLNRFLALVKRFSEGRQVILITHQKKTMEIADTIYGITMQSSGISKIISEKVDKANAKVN
jgi:chromosome segregation protein